MSYSSRDETKLKETCEKTVHFKVDLFDEFTHDILIGLLFQYMIYQKYSREN